jgi:hypothetical protein
LLTSQIKIEIARVISYNKRTAVAVITGQGIGRTIKEKEESWRKK